MKIRPFTTGDEEAIITLWHKCNLVRPQNNPRKDIERKLKVNPELFLVGVEGDRVVAAMMGGYDGHRGSVYYLGVDAAYQRKELGRQMMQNIEEQLKTRGCPKINLMFRRDNKKVEKFYEKLGYQPDACIEMVKRLIPD